MKPTKLASLICQKRTLLLAASFLVTARAADDDSAAGAAAPRLRSTESAAALPSSDDNQPIALETMAVSGDRPRIIDTTVFKLPLTLHDTPRSVTVFDAARFREQDFRTLNDTYRYVPGVFQRSQVNDAYHFMSRGFDMGPDETRLDGFTGIVTGGGFSPSLFGIEEVVYLRGPSGLVYGAAPTPGGTINLVSKKPREFPLTRVDTRYSTYAGGGVAFGSHTSTSIELDSTGPLTRDRTLLYRVVASAENSGFYTDDIHDRARNILASVTWKTGRDGRFTFTPIFEYQYAPFAANRALVISPGTSASTLDSRTGPIATSDLSPLTLNLGAGGRSYTRRIGGIDATAELSPAWRATAAYRFMAIDQEINAFVPQTGTLAQRDPGDPRSWFMSRRLTRSETDRRSHSFDVQLTHEAAAFTSVKTLTQLGFNGRVYRTTAARAAATQPNQSPINIYTGAALSPLVDPKPALIDSFLNDDFYWNAFAQNQTSIGERWVTTVGIGYGQQHFDRNYPANLPVPANIAQINATRRGEVTPNVSLLHNISRSLAAYTSYSTSYAPAPGDYEDATGQTGGFSPTTGTNYEVGLKYDPPSLPGKLTLSVFQTALDNVLVQSDATQLNARGNRFYTQTGGGRRTRGVEFSSELHPLRGWRVNFTGSFLDSRYRGEGRLPGSPTERTPRWAFAVFQRYDFARQSAWHGFGASLGVTWQDRRWSAARTSAAPDPLLLPAHTRVDAGLYYRRARWEISLHSDNVLDSRNWIGGTTGAALEPGAPRSLTLQTGYRF